MAHRWLPTRAAALGGLPSRAGFNPLVAASAFGMTGMLSVVGILAIGWLSDRFGRLVRHLLIYLHDRGHCRTDARVGLAIAVAGIWFVLFFGLMQGARGPIIVALVARLFPGGGVGAIYGTLSLAMGLGAALGSWLSGLALRVDRAATSPRSRSPLQAPSRALPPSGWCASLRQRTAKPSGTRCAIAAQCAKNTGSSAADRMWLVAPPKIIWRSRLCV